jgi:hypothetical protein
MLVRDRTYWSTTPATEWQAHEVELFAPYRSAMRDTHPRWGTRLGCVRYRIITDFGQLSPRYTVNQVWAIDLWHLNSRPACEKS